MTACNNAPGSDTSDHCHAQEDHAMDTFLYNQRSASALYRAELFTIGNAARSIPRRNNVVVANWTVAVYASKQKTRLSVCRYKAFTNTVVQLSRAILRYKCWQAFMGDYELYPNCLVDTSPDSWHVAFWFICGYGGDFRTRVRLFKNRQPGGTVEWTRLPGITRVVKWFCWKSIVLEGLYTPCWHHLCFCCHKTRL